MFQKINKVILCLFVITSLLLPQVSLAETIAPAPSEKSRPSSDNKMISSPIEVKAEFDAYGEVTLTWDAKAGTTYIITKADSKGHERTLAETNQGEINDICRKKGTYIYTVLPVCGSMPVSVATVKKIKIESSRSDLELKVSGRQIDIVGESTENADGYELVIDGRKETTKQTKITSEGEADTTVEYQVRAYKKNEETGEKIYTGKITRYVYVSDFDSNKAIEYARQYADNDKYNPEYRDYNPQGGDCANFVSQCLKAGGMAETDAWNYTDRGTSAWISVKAMYAYFSQKFEVIEYPTYDDFEPGDIVMKNDLSHVVLCSGKNEEGVPLICAHNDSHLDDPLYGDPGNWLIIRPTSGAVNETGDFTTTDQADEEVIIDEQNY